MKAAWLTALACLAALALVPGKAAAVACAPPGTAPPGVSAVPSGVSGVDQYFETIPAAGCKCGAANSGRRALSRSEIRRLTSEGAAGRAVIASVSAYAPPIPEAHPSGPPTASGENPIAALSRLMVTGSSTRTRAVAARSPCSNTGGSNTGAGLLLPLLLLVALVGTIAAMLLRRRRPQPSPA